MIGRAFSFLARPQEHSLLRSSFRAALWTLIGRGLGDFLRLASSLALTRLLAREHFGIIGTAQVVLALIQLFSDTGVQLAVIQNPRGEEREFLNAAWVISLLRGILLCLLAQLLAGPVAAFYGTPQLAGILAAMALALALEGAVNPARWLFTRRLQAEKAVLYEFTTQAGGVAATVALAVLLRSPWALAWGYLVSSGLRLAGSYLIDPFRPAFRLERRIARELFRFGRFVFLNTMVTWLTFNFDRLFLGKILGMAPLGVYLIGLNLGVVLEMVLLGIYSNSFFPALSRVAADRERMLRVCRRTLVLTAAFATPILAWVALFSRDLVAILYPPAFQGASVALFWISIRSIFRLLAFVQGMTFIALGRLELETMALLGGCLLTLVLLPALASAYGLEGACVAVFLVGVAVHLRGLLLLAWQQGFPLRILLLPLGEAALLGGAAWCLRLLLEPLLGGVWRNLPLMAVHGLLALAAAAVFYAWLERKDPPWRRAAPVPGPPGPLPSPPPGPPSRSGED